MFSRTLLVVTLAFAMDIASGFSHLPSSLARRSTRSIVKCQLVPDEKVVLPTAESPKPVATGGTDYSTLPKKEVTPLFLIPSTSIIGRGDLVGDLGFDPLGLATVSAISEYIL